MTEKPDSNSIFPLSADTKQAREEFFQGCIAGNIDRIRLMLMYSFDPNITDEAGNTPLMKAVQYGHLEIVKLLYSYLANITAKNNVGWSALEFAKYSYQPDIEFYLRIHGAQE